MKRFLLILSVLAATTVSAQWPATVNFCNHVSLSGVDAPVTDALGSLLGSSFSAQLYAGATLDSLTPVGTAVAFRNSSVTGLGTGYFSGGEVDILFLNPASGGWFQVKAWAAANGSSYEAALAANGTVGVSNVFHLPWLGDPNAPPPVLPADLVGLQPFTVQSVPEPTTLALGLLGALALLASRPRCEPRCEVEQRTTP
jgi:hypothetical protein